MKKSGNYIQGLVNLADAFYGSDDTRGLSQIEDLAIYCLENEIIDEQSDFIALSEYTEIALRALNTKNKKDIQSAKIARKVIEDDLKR